MAVLAALCACGSGEPQLDLAMRMSPELAMADHAVVVLFTAAPPTSCEVLRLSEKDEPIPKRGAYRSEVTISGTGPQDTEFFELVPGDYQIAVFVYAAGGGLVGFGCRPEPVTIELGKRTEAPVIEVRALP